MFFIVFFVFFTGNLSCLNIVVNDGQNTYMYMKTFFQRYKGDYHPRKDIQYDVPLTAQTIKDVFTDCSDLEARDVYIGDKPHGRATVFFIDGIVAGGDISESVIRPLTIHPQLSEAKTAYKIVDLMMHGAVWSASVKLRCTTDEAIMDLVNGYAVIVFDTLRTAVCYEAKTSNQRSIAEPSNEKSIKGAKDAFTETIRVNTSLVRRHLRTPALKFKTCTVGRKTHTAIAVAYIDGVANPETVGEILRRLDEIDIDGVISSGSLEEYISDSIISPIPQIMNTERPDRFAMNLLEGRIGIIVDGLPLGWLIPATIAQMLKVPEDKAQHFLIASALTMLRYIALFMSVLLPAVYVAVAMYHQEMIPTKLLISTIASKQQVPFSTAAEILGMLIAFELLQEAGLRLPNPVSDSVSIIGALIVGQSAIEANVISPIAVIVVAAAGIAGYTIPNQDLGSAIRLFRFSLVLAAMAVGIYGLMLLLLLILYHMCTLESFGVAYMSPLATRGVFSSILRLPLKLEKYRDPELRTPDKRNQA